MRKYSHQANRLLEVQAFFNYSKVTVKAMTYKEKITNPSETTGLSDGRDVGKGVSRVTVIARPSNSRPLYRATANWASLAVLKMTFATVGCTKLQERKEPTPENSS